VEAKLDADNFKKLRFVCFTSDAPQTHPSYVRAVTLSNRQPVTLSFDLSILAPFSIIKTVCTAPIAPDDDAETSTLTLPPGHNVTVTMRFTPPAKHKSRVVEDAQFSSDLTIAYTNNQVQVLPILANLYHPEVTIDVPSLDFGTQHSDVRACLTVTISNPSYSDASWSVAHQPKLYQATTFMASLAGDEAKSLASAKKEPTDDPEVFTFEPSSGVLAGRGRRPNMPATVTIKVYFQARARVEYMSRFRFKVLSGRGVELSLKACGSFEEQHDTLNV